jgi:chromosome segregation ATPase
MSEERFDRLENQLTQVIQAIGTMQQHISGIEQKVVGIEQRVTGIEQRVTGIEQNISAMQSNINAVREDVNSLRRRVESNEGTLIVAIREGFRSQEYSMNDLNYDLSVNERKTRRLSRRVARLERQDLDD